MNHLGWIAALLLLTGSVQAQQVTHGPYTLIIEQTTPTVLLRVQADEVLPCNSPPAVPHTRRVAGGAVVNLMPNDVCAGTDPLPPENLQVLYDLGPFADGTHELHFETCPLPPPGGCSPFATLGFTVQGGNAYALFIPPTQSRQLKIAPGESGRLSFTMIRNDTSAQPRDYLAYYYSTAAALAEYQWSSTDPIACPPPQQSGEFSLFFAGPTDPGSRSCAYEIHRNQDSFNDLSFDFCNYSLSCRNGHFFLGSLPDQSLEIEPAGPATDLEATMRVRLRNLSEFDGLSRVVNSECMKRPNYLTSQSEPFTVDTDFPGACETVTLAPPFAWGCFSFGVDEILSQTMLQLGPAPALGESTCLLKLRFHNEAGRRASVKFRLSDPGTDLAGGARLFDVNPGNDRVRLGADPIFEDSLEDIGPYD